MDVKVNEQGGPFLQVRDLCVEYVLDEETVRAVNSISFDLERGRTLGLVGETGAGKTTVAKSILRILPDPPAVVRQGEILVDGVDVLRVSEAEMRAIRGSKISMIFQDPMTALNPVMRVGEQISEVVLLHNEVSKREADERAMKMLEMVGISSERFSEYPHQFSGGMKQRVVIAMALACSPQLLLADEPTTALDVTIQAQVLEMINQLKDEFNTAMVLITHDLAVVAEVCDDVAVVYAGEIIEQGSKFDLFVNPTHPYTKGLFGALPDMNSDVERLSPILGSPPDPTNLPDGCSFRPRCPAATDACKQERIPVVELSPGHLCRCCNITRKGD